MKKIMEVVGIIGFNLLLIIGLGLTFSVIFAIASSWLIYGCIIVRRIAQRQNKKWILTLSKFYDIGIAIFIISFVLIESFLVFNIYNYKTAGEIETLDYVIVLGAGLRGEEVSNTLKIRLDEAIKYYRQNLKTTIIVSGGQGADEVISEAEAMKRYLEREGVPEAHIIKEDKSTTTFENIAFSKDILEERGHQEDKVLIVTNDYHLFRAQMIAYFMGLRSEGLPAMSAPLVRMNYLVREYPTLMIHFIQSLIQ